MILAGIAKCIMSGNTLKKVFESTFEKDSILTSFNFWLSLFFLCGAIFSFRSIDKTKPLQYSIILMRILSIIMMIGGALYLIFRNGVKPIIPSGKGVFNYENFLELFSNSIFALMVHHALPGIMDSLKENKDRQNVLKLSFSISPLLLLIISITGCMAFGDDLGSGKKLKYYNFDF